MAQKKNKFGIQLWTVKEALAKDPLGVLKHLSNCGYKQIESFEGANGMFWGMKNTEFKKQLGDMEMNMIASHCDINNDFDCDSVCRLPPLPLTPPEFDQLTNRYFKRTGLVI